MSHEIHYPEITTHVEWSIKMIIALALENATYFEDEACPYGADFKNAFLSLIKRKVVIDQPGETTSAQTFSDDEIDANIAGDLYKVFTDLKDYGKKIPESDQTERMAYFRTATSLLERLVTARERALGIKQVRAFQDTVLSIMEESMSPDQRTEVMERLSAALTTPRGEDESLTITTTQEPSNEN